MYSTLQQLVDNSRTDKNTTHSYLGLYEELLQTKKYTAKNVLEIGNWKLEFVMVEALNYGVIIL